MTETDAGINGTVALVTGGSRGIGRMIALALAGAGAHVAVNHRNHAAEAEEVCQEIGRHAGVAGAFQADISVAAEVAQMVAQVQERLGPVAILVNNAGVTRPEPLEAISERSWDEVLAINLKSVFLVTQAVLPAMRAAGWGRIINLS